MDKSFNPKPIRTDPRPLYTQTIETITNLILEGEYKIGDRLPKENIFARQLGISRSTLRVALGYLETYGLISRRPGVGTFIATTLTSPRHGGYISGLDRLETLLKIAERAGVEAQIVSREISATRASAELAADFSVSEGVPLLRVEVVEAIDGQIAAYLDTYLMSAMIDQDALFDYQDDVIKFLARESELAPTHTRSEIWAINANKGVAEKLGLEENQAILHLEETFYTREGTCVAYSQNYFASEIFRFYLLRRIVALD